MALIKRQAKVGETIEVTNAVLNFGYVEYKVFEESPDVSTEKLIEDVAHLAQEYVELTRKYDDLESKILDARMLAESNATSLYGDIIDLQAGETRLTADIALLEEKVDAQASGKSTKTTVIDDATIDSVEFNTPFDGRDELRLSSDSLVAYGHRLQSLVESGKRVKITIEEM